MKINYKALRAVTAQYLRGTISIIAILLVFSVIISKAAFANCTPGATANGDVITCDNADDAINGGNGDDTITDSGGNNVITGGNGNDTITTGAGNDNLTGSAGNDNLTGGAGNDSYRFDTDTNLNTDTIDENGGGTDNLNFTGSTNDVTVDLSATGSQVVNGNLTIDMTGPQIENVIGGSGNDTISGNDSNNLLNGGSGNDTLNGGIGNDTLLGGAGDDVLNGEAGNDVYRFDADTALGTDTVNETSGNGTDTLSFAGTDIDVSANLGATGNQAVNGNLTINITAPEIENIVGGNGNDTLTGNDANNSLTGGLGDDVLTGGLGNDTYRFDTDNNLETDIINEASSGGTDTINFTGSTANNNVDLSITATQTVNSNLVLDMNGPEIENVVGGSGNDAITGNAADNNLNGGDGNDTIKGGDGDDVLTGGAGVDNIDGGAGNDVLRILGANEFGDIVAGGAGSNTFQVLAGATGQITLVTTSGADTLNFVNFDAPITIDLNNQSEQEVSTGLFVTLQGWFKNIFGTSSNDTITGNDLNNSINAGAGNDTAIIGTGDITFNVESILTATTPAPTTPAPTTPAPTTPAPTTPAPTTPAPTTPAPTTPAPTTPAPSITATTPAPAIGGGDPDEPETENRGSGKPVEIGCESNPYLMGGFSGSRVAYHDLCGYSTIATTLPQSSLPGDLPANSTYVSGISIQLFKNQKPSSAPAGTKIQIIFPLPASYEGTPIGLTWDATQQIWVTVPVEIKDGNAIIDATQGGIYILVLR